MQVVHLRQTAAPTQRFPRNPLVVCPVKSGTRVLYGWRKLFWHKVREVGDAWYLPSGWLVPVQYGNGDHALLYYRFGEQKAATLDHLVEIRSTEPACTQNLHNSLDMPKIVSVAEGAVIVHVCQLVESNDEYLWHEDVESYRRYEIRLYGVLSLENRRRDEIELLPGTF